MVKVLKKSKVVLVAILMSGCTTVHYDKGMNMTPIQWVKYLAGEHSGWPTSFVVTDNSEDQYIIGTIRSYRGSLSFKNSMDEYCSEFGGATYESNGRFSCYNASGPTYYYTLRDAPVSQGPTFSVTLVGLVRGSRRAEWGFFKNAKFAGAVFPPESISEYGPAER